MWRIWRVYSGVTRGETKSMSISKLRLHCTTITHPHYPFLEETCLIMFILVPHAMCLYLILSHERAINVRQVQGRHQDGNDEKQLLSNYAKPCDQIVYYGTTDNNSPSTKSSHSSCQSVGSYYLPHHSSYEHKNVKYLCQPPDYKWGNEIYHKDRHRHHFNKDVGRWFKRQSRQQVLITYSILQAFGWGSVLALSWTIWKSHSLYLNSKQQCPIYYLPFQAESSNDLFNKEMHNQLLKVCDNENAEKYSGYFNSNQCHNYNYNFNPDIDRSLFSYLYSVACSQPVINSNYSNVKDKKKSSKRAHYRKENASLQPNLGTPISEGDTHSESYSQDVNRTNTSLNQHNINLQQACLSQNCENPKVSPCVNDKTAVNFEQSSSNTGNDNNQNQFSTKTEAKPAKEIVTIEDCSESGISSSNSNNLKKINASRNEEKAEDVKKVIQEEIKAIREIQDKVNGLIQRDLGISQLDMNPKSAVLHFQAGALLGDADATFNLALCLHMGKGVKQNYKLARKYYSEASKSGHNWATYNLAVLVSQGLGGVADNDLAYDLLQSAAEGGVKEAKEALKAMEEEGEEEEDNIEETGMIANSESLSTMISEPYEKVNSTILDKQQCSIDVTYHFETLALSRDLSVSL